MSNFIVWNTRRIFITSTFSDMQAERDYLRNHVFPRLEHELKERFHHLETVDLRWGVEAGKVKDEAERELLILKVCLEEIKLSRPFLIGLIGDRYGWVPDASRMKNAAQNAGFKKDLTHKSVTELEILYGILESEEQQHRSWIYLRDPLPYDQIPSKIAAKYSEEYCDDQDARLRKTNLQSLKERLKDELPGRTKNYSTGWDKEKQCVTGLEEWGERVFKHLWSDLKKYTEESLRDAPKTWEEQETLSLEKFIEGRARGFVGREVILKELKDFCLLPDNNQPDWGICVTGEAGTGKSSLFAKLKRDLQDQNVILLSHAAGISVRSTQVNAMLRRWIFELSNTLDERVYLKDKSNTEEVEKEFARLLGFAGSKKRVVILIDALNQFEQNLRARYMNWLPKLFPSNVRLIATTIPCESATSLIKLTHVKESPITLLTEKESEAIAKSVCERHHRTLNQKVLKTFTEKKHKDQPAAGNALWLELAMEELNRLDADDFARGEEQFAGIKDNEERLIALLVDTAQKMPADVAGLYNWMINRAEKLYGGKWVQGFLFPVALSRYGLRELDLKKLMPKLSGEEWDDLKFASLRYVFGHHIVQRGEQGQWDFFHTQMRITIEQRMKKEGIDSKTIHTAIVDHLEQLSGETDVLRQTELMYHLIGTDDRLWCARYYGRPMSSMEKKGSTNALAGYIVEGSHHASNYGLTFALAMLKQEDITNDEKFQICNRYNFDLHDLLVNESNLATRRMLIEAVRERLSKLTILDRENTVWQRELSISYDRIGDIQKVQGQLSEALKSYEVCRGIREELMAKDPKNAQGQRDLSLSYDRIGDIQKTQGKLSEALKSYEVSKGIREELSAKDPENTQGQRDLAISYEKVGDIQQVQGQLSEALKSCEVCRGITEELTAKDPENTRWQWDLAISYKDFAALYGQKGEAEIAVKYEKECLSVLRRMKEAGMFMDPPLVELLNQLEKKFG